MFSKVQTAVCRGVDGKPVSVETDIRSGLPNMNIVGLASTTVIEAKERIRSAIINSGFEYPKGRITINLTPADLRKSGSSMDLPIAVGLLVSSLYIDPAKVSDYGILGALSLDGEVLGIDGVLPMVFGMAEYGIKKIIVPMSNYREALMVKGVEVIPVDTLVNCVEIINGRTDAVTLKSRAEKESVTEDIRMVSNPQGIDYIDIKGQENAKRAISIAVTGRHGMLMVGSPGCGKTMLARRIPTIMPEMTERELIETTVVYSAAGRNNKDGTILTDRPFRSPHNSIGRAGLLGGGLVPVPGEISLAHNGVLFLDEICEFEREKIESLRQPLEDKTITHFRQGVQYTFPCNFQLVMASNPCKCGYYGDNERMCTCSQLQIEQYQRKLSGPMMDRIDIRISMEKVRFKEISDDDVRGRSSDDLKKDVEKGLNFAAEMGRRSFNANMTDAEIVRYCSLGTAENALMKTAYKTLGLSPRSYKKTLKVARTIADMSESTEIKEEHLAEALSYRIINEMNVK